MTTTTTTAVERLPVTRPNMFFVFDHNICKTGRLPSQLTKISGQTQSMPLTATTPFSFLYQEGLHLRSTENNTLQTLPAVVTRSQGKAQEENLHVDVNLQDYYIAKRRG